jgi:hypothetical protein
VLNQILCEVGLAGRLQVRIPQDVSDEHLANELNLTQEGFQRIRWHGRRQRLSQEVGDNADLGCWVTLG